MEGGGMAGLTHLSYHRATALHTRATRLFNTETSLKGVVTIHTNEGGGWEGAWSCDEHCRWRFNCTTKDKSPRLRVKRHTMRQITSRFTHTRHTNTKRMRHTEQWQQTTFGSVICLPHILKSNPSLVSRLGMINSIDWQCRGRRGGGEGTERQT